jgi:hypothetical protein
MIYVPFDLKYCIGSTCVMSLGWEHEKKEAYMLFGQQTAAFFHVLNFNMLELLTI